jgi:hypothetical protein
MAAADAPRADSDFVRRRHGEHGHWYVAAGPEEPAVMHQDTLHRLYERRLV